MYEALIRSSKLIIHSLPKRVSVFLSQAPGKRIACLVKSQSPWEAWPHCCPQGLFLSILLLFSESMARSIRSHTQNRQRKTEWVRISASFALVTGCCITSYPKAHCLDKKYLTFLIMAVVCEFGSKLEGQLSCGSSQHVESEGNVCKMTSS